MGAKVAILLFVFLVSLTVCESRYAR